MSEIKALPWNGFRVASFFAGCGGSSLGYRMAGFRVVYANEFVARACESYKANASPLTYLEERSIREVEPADVLERTGLKVGELDVLDGSPPCNPFSTVGRVEKDWNTKKAYHEHKQRVDDLFFEYIRILRGVRPKVFVAENVAGLVRGVSKGYFLQILAALRMAGYRVRCCLVDGEWLGLPQSRRRTIFVGVRDDLDLDPVFPAPLPYRYVLGDVFPYMRRVIDGAWIEREAEKVAPELRPGPAYLRELAGLGPGDRSRLYFQLCRLSPNKPSPTIVATSSGNFVCPHENRRFSIDELRAICGFPADFILKGRYSEQWERLGLAVPPVMMARIAEAVRDGILIPSQQQAKGRKHARQARRTRRDKGDEGQSGASGR